MTISLLILVTTVLGAILGIARGDSRARRWVAFGLVLVGAGFAFLNDKTSRDQVEVVRNYADVARRGMNGYYQRLEGTYFATDDPLYLKLQESVREEESGYYISCEERDLKNYDDTIQSYPTFPFGYFYVAFCKWRVGDDGWRIYADQAEEIFVKTTTIDGHNPEQGQALRKLRAEFEEG